MHNKLLQRGNILEQLNLLYPEDDFIGLERLPTIRNITYAVNAVNGRYIFKLSPIEACEPLLRENSGIREIYNRGGAVPRPLPIKDETDCIAVLEDACYAVRGYEFIEGEVPIVSENSFHSLGAAIGSFHNVWKSEERPSFLPEMKLADMVYGSLDDINGRFPNSRMKYFRKLSQSVSEVLSDNREPYLLGVTHGDLHHMNAIKASQGIILIDLEDIGWQWRVYDLATAIWGTFGRGGSAFIWDELINGYSAVHDLSQTEAMLIRYLIFVRHLWWLGLNARNWELWPRRYTIKQFFEPGLELLDIIAKEVCGLN